MVLSQEILLLLKELYYKYVRTYKLKFKSESLLYCRSKIVENELKISISETNNIEEKLYNIVDEMRMTVFKEFIHTVPKSVKRSEIENRYGRLAYGFECHFEVYMFNIFITLEKFIENIKIIFDPSVFHECLKGESNKKQSIKYMYYHYRSKVFISESNYFTFRTKKYRAEYYNLRREYKEDNYTEISNFNSYNNQYEYESPYEYYADDSYGAWLNKRDLKNKDESYDVAYDPHDGGGLN